MSNTEQFLQEAIQLHQTGRLTEAGIAYLRVLETEPDQSLIYSQVGQSLFGLGRPADAERVFEIAANRFPEDTLPVVCFNGNRWVSRVAATIVTAVNHPEWAGKDLDDYIRIAASLAGDADRLQRIRGRLRDEMAGSMLCDTAGFTAKLETAFEDMVRSKGIGA